MKGAPAIVFVIFVLLFLPRAAVAQPSAARVANPGTVEFQVQRNEQADAGAYRVELFVTGSDTTLAVPVKVMDLYAMRRDAGEPLRIDIRGALEGVLDGEYVATVRIVHADGTSARSQPTAPFVVSGYTVSRPNIVMTSPPASDPPLTADEKRRERFWTKVAIAVGAGAMLIPFAVH